MKNFYQSSFGGKPRIKVLVDADIVLELFINREGFVEDAEKLLMEMAQSQQIELYVTHKCLKRIRLELSDTDDQLGEEAAYKVEAILSGRIIQIDRSIREQARKSPLKDFDSAEELVCAIANQFDAIVTQNPQNFDGTNSLLIWSVESLQACLQLNKNLLIQYAEEKPEIFSSGSASFFSKFRQEEVIVLQMSACGSGKTFGPLFLEHFKSYNFLYFSGHSSFQKPRKRINLSSRMQIKFEEFDNWITSNEALLLFRNNYRLLNNYRTCKSRIYHTIYSPKYLHKYLIELLLDKFPKKNVNNYYDLPFCYSPHQLQLLQHNSWIWRLKLSLTVALNLTGQQKRLGCS